MLLWKNLCFSYCGQIKLQQEKQKLWCCWTQPVEEMWCTSVDSCTSRTSSMNHLVHCHSKSDASRVSYLTSLFEPDLLSGSINAGWKEQVLALDQVSRWREAMWLLFNAIERFAEAKVILTNKGLFKNRLNFFKMTNMFHSFSLLLMIMIYL